MSRIIHYHVIPPDPAPGDVTYVCASCGRRRPILVSQDRPRIVADSSPVCSDCA